MDGKGHVPMEQLEVFRSYVEIADWVWRVVQRWKPLAQSTVGKQLIRAADSVGANLVEGDGRYTVADGLHFLVVARASARETRYWLQRAAVRGLIGEGDAASQVAAINSATRQLNTLIQYRRSTAGAWKVREAAGSIEVDWGDPFTEDMSALLQPQYPTPNTQYLD